MRRLLNINLSFNLIIRGRKSRTKKVSAIKYVEDLVPKIKILLQDTEKLLRQLEKNVFEIVRTLTYLNLWQHIWKAENAAFEMLLNSGLNILFDLALLVWLFNKESK